MDVVNYFQHTTYLSLIALFLMHTLPTLHLFINDPVESLNALKTITEGTNVTKEPLMLKCSGRQEDYSKLLFFLLTLHRC